MVNSSAVTVDSVVVVVERVAVYGRTSWGRRVRLVNRTEADRELNAGWEIGLRRDTDGQWRLSWLPDTEIVEIEIEIEEEPLPADVPAVFAA